MDDTKNMGTTEPVKDTQDAPMPSAEQKTQDQVVTDPKSEETQQSGLPDEASERTKAEFEKVKTDRDEYREQLKKEREQREYYESVFNNLNTEPTRQPQAVYDPETGLINEQVLTDTQRAAYEAKDRAARAEEALKKYQYEQENREVFKTYPELNPEVKETFDKDLHRETRSLMLDSMVNPQDYGKQLSFMEAAAQAKTKLGRNVEEAKKEGATEAMEVMAAKEQASVEAQGNVTRAESLSDSELADLQYRSRRGEPGAIAERLKRLRTTSSGG